MSGVQMVEYALRYASMGWDVFPLQARNKLPFKDFAWNLLATTNENKIKEWWRKYPDANIGVACGKRSQIIVLDIDIGHGGEESIEGLCNINGRLPDTPQAATGGGGRHIVFLHPGVEIRNSASKLGPGIDVRGDGGYIVAPPSIHPNGKRYTWIPDYKPSETPLACIPQWLLVELAQSHEAEVKETQAPDGTAPNKIMPGQRDMTLTSLAGTMRKRGMSGEALLAALLAENQARCVPPLDEEDVKRIVKSVERYDRPVETNQGKRIEAEWMLAAAAFVSPEVAIQDAGYIQPYIFRTPCLEHFWQQMINGADKVQAATEADILKELISMQSKVNVWDTSLYAAQVTRFDYLENIGFRLCDAQHSIDNGDATATQKIINEMASILPGTSRDPMGGDKLRDEFITLLDHLEGRSIRTGIRGIDRATGGLERETFSILAARPSMGKSTLAWQIARQVAERNGQVLFFSLEMAASQLIAKTACGEMGLRWKDIRAGMKDDDRINLKAKADELARRWGNNLLIDDNPSSTEIIWQTTARYKPDLVIIDHLRLVQDKEESEVRRLGMITKRFKQLAKQYKCHVLCLAQLNRAAEQRDQKRPQLADLRDSGEIEENADLVMMIYRDEYYNEDKTLGRYSETEIWLRKYRDDVRNQKITLEYDTTAQMFIEPEDKPR